MRKILAASFVMLLMFSACKSEAGGQSLAFDDVLCVRQFTNSITLEKGETVEVGDIGVRNLMVCDDLLFVITGDPNGFFSVYTLPDMQFAGKYVLKGNGPGELTFYARKNAVTPVMTPDGVRLYFDDYRGSLLEWNVAESIQEGRTVIGRVADSPQGGPFCSIFINDSTVFSRVIRSDGRGQTRFMTVAGNTVITPEMERLNEVSVPADDGVSFNIVGSLTGFSRERGLIVEASLNLNTINMYTLSGDFAKTVCLGKRPDDVTAVFNDGQMKQISTFTDICVCEDWFAVMYSGAKEHPLVPGEGPKPKICIFDYAGNPLTELLLPVHADCFTIDPVRSSLYTLNSSDEIITEYDLSAILKFELD